MTEKTTQNTQRRMQDVMNLDQSFSPTTSSWTRFSSLSRIISIVLKVMMDANIFVHWTSVPLEAIAFEKLNCQRSCMDPGVMSESEVTVLLTKVEAISWFTISEKVDLGFVYWCWTTTKPSFVCKEVAINRWPPNIRWYEAVALWHSKWHCPFPL